MVACCYGNDGVREHPARTVMRKFKSEATGKRIWCPSDEIKDQGIKSTEVK